MIVACCVSTAVVVTLGNINDIAGGRIGKVNSGWSSDSLSKFAVFLNFFVDSFLATGVCCVRTFVAVAAVGNWIKGGIDSSIAVARGI